MLRIKGLLVFMKSYGQRGAGDLFKDCESKLYILAKSFYFC